MKNQHKILDGRLASDSILEDISREISQIISETGENPPKLGVILVGNNPASESYVKNKIKACQKTGIHHQLIRLDPNISEDNLLSIIQDLNNDNSISGFIVQLPLPEHIDVNKVISEIHPDKDVDGFHPMNFGKTSLGLPSMKPATPYGILKLIKFYNIDTKGKHVVVVGRSNIVGKPLSIMLGNDFDIGRATVTSCDINTPRELLLGELKRAHIIIIAVGIPNFLNDDMISEGSIVIDVGINKIGNAIVGDVNYDSVIEKCSQITPVPGGIGPMTISALMVNTLNAWKKK